MRDQLGRDIDYLRISLTERCNLKCIYCREKNEHCKAKRELNVQQYEQLMKQFVRFGIRKVRLTGGEPLVRKDLEEIVRLISAYSEITELCMTTNAQGLKERLPELKRAGLKRINISMDSLNPACYRKMTRGGDLWSVLMGIDAALTAGIPVKINVVLIRGENDGEVEDFLTLAKKYPIDVRFIELMPFGVLGEKGDRRILSSEILQAHPELVPAKARYLSQPAEDYTAEGYLGRIGFISPISHKFCKYCNRVRLTSDGKLRMCLGNNWETDLKPYLTGTEDELGRIIEQTIYQKPEQHMFEETYHASRAMNQIGG